jgi:hypothetical protein
MPLGSVEEVSVTVTFDDGSTEVGDHGRKAVLMP